jgi:hypothetical protein
MLLRQCLGTGFVPKNAAGFEAAFIRVGQVLGDSSVGLFGALRPDSIDDL